MSNSTTLELANAHRRIDEAYALIRTLGEDLEHYVEQGGEEQSIRLHALEHDIADLSKRVDILDKGHRSDEAVELERHVTEQDKLIYQLRNENQELRVALAAERTKLDQLRRVMSEEELIFTRLNSE